MGLDNYNYYLTICARSCTCTFHRTVERKCVKQETREKMSVDFYFCPWWKEKRVEATALNSWFDCFVNALYLFSTQHLSRTHTQVKLGVDSFGRYEKSMHIQLVHPASRNKRVFRVVHVCPYQWAWWRDATSCIKRTWLAYRFNDDDTSNQATCLASLPALNCQSSTWSVSAW